jgi:hypothetical protein
LTTAATGTGIAIIAAAGAEAFASPKTWLEISTPATVATASAAREATDTVKMRMGGLLDLFRRFGTRQHIAAGKEVWRGVGRSLGRSGFGAPPFARPFDQHVEDGHEHQRQRRGCDHAAEHGGAE